MAWITVVSWDTVSVPDCFSSMGGNVDSSRDSNVGAHARTAVLLIRLPKMGSVVAGGGRAGDGVDTALKADGAGDDGTSVDLVEQRSIWSSSARAASWLPVRA
jgi:hypothetical protein